jgi:hypothetical protein
VGFEPTIPAFEQTKTVRALDCAGAVIGCSSYNAGKILKATSLTGKKNSKSSPVRSLVVEPGDCTLLVPQPLFEMILSQRHPLLTFKTIFPELPFFVFVA